MRVITLDEAVRGAVRHFLLHGNLDMNRLATELSVSRATLYRVTGSRDALLGHALWRLARRLLDVARAERSQPGADGVIEVSRVFAERLRTSDPMRAFVAAEPETAARVLFIPSGIVHRRIVPAQRDIFVENAIFPRNAPGLVERAFLYVRIMESILYGELFSRGGNRIAFALAEPALRAVLARHT